MPSASKRTARPSFYEVVFQGSPKVVRGFLAGLQIGCGEQTTVLYHFDAEIFDESQAGRLAERIGFKRADCHVVVDRSLCDRLRKLADEIAEETGLVIESCRNVRSAELSFKFTVYARRYQQDIMKLIKELPAGLRVAEAPVDYRRRIGDSKVSGTLPGVVGAGIKIPGTIARFALSPPRARGGRRTG